MESTQNDPTNRYQKEDDIDLGMLLYKMGQAISRFFRFLAYCFVAMFQSLIVGLLFLRKNFLWLLLGTVLGLAFGIYQNITQGTRYSSTMTVRSNFGSARALYGSVEYLNALISASDNAQLANIFGITAKEAASLSSFTVEPITDELVVAEMYRDNFMRFERGDLVRTDTFWSKTITFADFKRLITRYDYPLHEIHLVSTSQTIFQKLGKGISKLVTQNDVLQNNKRLTEETFKEEEQVLKSSIEGLDTLRKTYNKKLLIPNSDASGPSVNLIDKSLEVSSPELEIYDKILLMNGQIKALRKEVAKNREIVQVYSPFNSHGSKQSVLRQSYFSQALTGLVITLIILIVIAFNKYLGSIDSTGKRTRASEIIE